MKRNHQWFLGALAALAMAVGLPALAHARTLGVEVWTDRGDDAVYQPGDAMQVKVRASDDAYLLVYQIDSNGRVSVLFPWRRNSGLIEGRRTYRMPPERSGYELAVEKAIGEGFIVALASRRPFRDLPWYLRPFDPQGDAMGYEGHEDLEEGIDEDGQIVGDPMVAMERIRRRVLDQPSDTDDFATAYASYYVGHEVRYPRYLCADCHRPGRWAWWSGFDPYHSRCSVFDFRVNWNWCWGPCIWTGHVPYFYYVVRHDCPPRYRGWYDDRSRWSSWDGYNRWNNLWGGNITRYKPTPPPDQTAPPPVYKPGGPPQALPPGYLPSQGNGYRRDGFRAPVPIGHNREERGSSAPGRGERGELRPTPPRQTPSGDRDGSSDPGANREPQPRPSLRPPREDSPRQAPQVDSPRQRPPREDSPRQAPQVDSPRQRPPRESPAPKPENPQRVDPPKREHERQSAPRSEPPPQRPPRQDDDGGRRGRGR